MRALGLPLCAALLSLLLPGRAHATSRKAEPVRVREARRLREAEVRAWFKSAGVAWPAKALLLRAFKLDDQLELWAGDDRAAPLTLVHTFAICARSGGPGPKRKAGDGQVPEGFYTVSQLNPASNFHLSLRVSYPNRADRLRSAARDLGGDIFIHGDCVTIGCLPLQDGPIEALYLAVLDAKAAGAKTEVHLFPARFDEAGRKKLAALEEKDPSLASHWRELSAGYDAFERGHVLPEITIDAKGRYVVR